MIPFLDLNLLKTRWSYSSTHQDVEATNAEWERTEPFKISKRRGNVHRGRLRKLIRMDLKSASASGITNKFVTPLLESFGHSLEKLRFERGNTDVLIYNEDRTICVVVETKRPGTKLHKSVRQLADYCTDQRAALGVLTDGREVWFYDPNWHGRSFGEAILYTVTRADLIKEKHLQFAESVLSSKAIGDGSVLQAMSKRRSEVIKMEETIKSFHDHLAKIEELLSERAEALGARLDRASADVQAIVRELTTIKGGAEEFVQSIAKEVGLPLPSLRTPPGIPVKGRRVTAGQFEHRGKGIFVLSTDKRVKLDVSYNMATVQEDLAKYAHNTKCLSSFYNQLRKKANLLRKPTTKR